MTTPRLQDVITNAARVEREKVHTAFPAKILTYDPLTQVATVQPSVKIRVVGEDGLHTAHSMPAISDCPVAFPGGGGVSIVWPLLPGDDVLLVVASHSIADWLQVGGSEIEPQSTRRHDLTDAVVIPQVRAKTNPRANAITGGSDLVMGQEDGTFEVRITATDVKLGDATATDFVALASLVLGELTAIKTAFDLHTHTGVTVGVGVSGVPVAPLPSPSSVAATKVKAT